MPALGDTNILVHCFDPRFPKKQLVATDLLRRGIAEEPLYVPHPALVEFVAETTRPLPDCGPLLTRQEAIQEAENLANRCQVLYSEGRMFCVALHGYLAHGFGMVRNDPSVSHDGTIIVFEGRVGTTAQGRPLYNLFSVQPDGSNPTRLTAQDGASDIWPSFSPDEGLIASFIHVWEPGGGYASGFRVAEPGGSSETKISSFPWGSFPSWYPREWVQVASSIQRKRRGIEILGRERGVEYFCCNRANRTRFKGARHENLGMAWQTESFIP